LSSSDCRRGRPSPRFSTIGFPRSMSLGCRQAGAGGARRAQRGLPSDPKRSRQQRDTAEPPSKGPHPPIRQDSSAPSETELFGRHVALGAPAEHLYGKQGSARKGALFQHDGGPGGGRMTRVPFFYPCRADVAALDGLPCHARSAVRGLRGRVVRRRSPAGSHKRSRESPPRWRGADHYVGVCLR